MRRPGATRRAQVRAAVSSRSPGVGPPARRLPQRPVSCAVLSKASGLGVECCSVSRLCLQPGSLRLPGLVRGHLGSAPSLRLPRPGTLKTHSFAVPPSDYLSISVLQPRAIWKGIRRTQVECPLGKLETPCCPLLVNDVTLGGENKHMEEEVARAIWELPCEPCPFCAPWLLQPDLGPSLLSCGNFLSRLLRLSSVPHTSSEGDSGISRGWRRDVSYCTRVLRPVP